MRFFIFLLIGGLLSACGGSKDSNLVKTNRFLVGFVEAAMVQDVDIYKLADSDRVKSIAANGILAKLHAVDAMRPVSDWSVYTLGTFCFIEARYDSISSRADIDLAKQSKRFIDSIIREVRKAAEEKKVVKSDGSLHYITPDMKFCYK